MEKQPAQPKVNKSSSISSTEQMSFNLFEGLCLDDRKSSIAQTSLYDCQNQTMIKKEPLFKTKFIGKDRASHEKSNKKKENIQKKVQFLTDRIKQLERQIQSLRRKQDYCPKCHYFYKDDMNQNYRRELIIPEQPCNVAGSYDNRRTSKESVQFEKIDFTTPLMFNPDMEEKSWIFLGIMMIAMGSKVMDVDGTINVFRVLQQSVDNIRRQVQKSEKKIQMQFFMSKEQITGESMHNIDIDPFFIKEEPIHPGGFQMEGVKVLSVHEYDLLYDQKINFSVNYESLLTIMEYAREHCSIG